MKTSRAVLCIGLAAAVLGPLPAGASEAAQPAARPSIPYVATRNDAVADMLWMAGMGKDDVVYDLGSGDGRIVVAAVRDFGARRAVGVEIDPERVRQSRENASKAGVADRAEFLEGDLFATDLGQASVVALFLGHEPNLRLRPAMLRTLKPGARIVSHQFAMGEWEPDKALTVRTAYFGMWGEEGKPFGDNPRVPDYTGNESHYGTSDRIAMWVVPAGVAGVWRGAIDTAKGPQQCRLVLHQRLSKVTGTLEVSGQTGPSGTADVELWGSHLRYACETGGQGYGRLRFDGHVEGDTMHGMLEVADRGQTRQSQWKAQRDQADLTGTWQWTCATGPRPVRLRIERRDGHLVASYLDRDVSVPVTDFYDCGGGFYFTLLVGRRGAGVTITEDTGWLIGEGVLDRGELKGTIEFHPYRGVPTDSGAWQPPGTATSWAPRRVQRERSE